MLKELQISGFALIDKVHLTFYSGFSVLTGETGAGKSIIIDALSLLLGSRASTEMIRTGCNRAVVEGQFDAPPTIGSLLEQWGIDNQGDLILSREIYINGRNKCRINGSLATVSQLSQLGAFLVDILGQHDHQSLLNTTRHLDILDSFGDQAHNQLRQEVAFIYQQYQQTRQKILSLQNQERERLSRIDLLKYQIHEIKQAELKVGEEDRLIKERDKLANIEKISVTTESVYGRLQEQFDDQLPLYDLIAAAISELSQLSKFDENIVPIIEMFNEALIQLEEGSRDLRTYMEEFERDPQALEKVEERLAILRALKRKYGDSEQAILDYSHKIEVELDELVNSEQTVSILQKKQDKLLAKLDQLATNLSDKRKHCAAYIEKEIEAQLQDMNMENVRFAVDISRTELNETGCDKIEFKISPNIGEELKQLAKIASGGEMSRIMLALKNCLAQHDQIPTLIFDEVDSGIGGHTAKRIGDKLRNLSKGFQLFAVTHLPVVAGYAENHYFVEKHEVDGRTIVTVALLDSSKRVAELARMLGGKEGQEITAAHAKELLKYGNTS